MTSNIAYRWRLKNGSNTPWKAPPRGFMLVNPDAEGIEFREVELVQGSVASSPRSAPSTAGTDGPDSTS